MRVHFFLQISHIAGIFADVVIVDLKNFISIRQNLNSSCASFFVSLHHFADLRMMQN